MLYMDIKIYGRHEKKSSLIFSSDKVCFWKQESLKIWFFSGDQMKIYKVILSPFGEAFNFEFYSKLNR